MSKRIIAEIVAGVVTATLALGILSSAGYICYLQYANHTRPILHNNDRYMETTCYPILCFDFTGECFYAASNKDPGIWYPCPKHNVTWGYHVHPGVSTGGLQIDNLPDRIYRYGTIEPEKVAVANRTCYYYPDDPWNVTFSLYTTDHSNAIALFIFIIIVVFATFGLIAAGVGVFVCSFIYNWIVKPLVEVGPRPPSAPAGKPVSDRQRVVELEQKLRDQEATLAVVIAEQKIHPAPQAPQTLQEQPPPSYAEAVAQPPSDAGRGS